MCYTFAIKLVEGDDFDGFFRTKNKMVKAFCFE